VARVLQVEGDEGRDRALVLDDQDGFGRLRHLGEHATRGGYCPSGLEIMYRVGFAGSVSKLSSQKLAASYEKRFVSWPGTSVNPAAERIATARPTRLRLMNCAFRVSFVGPLARKRIVDSLS